jgi:CRISPR-associated protein Cas6
MMLSYEIEDSELELVDVNPYVNVRFDVFGKEIDIDHVYALYSAFCHQEPLLHQIEEIAMTAITGSPTPQGLLKLTPDSHFIFRVLASQVPLIYPLSEQPVKLGKYQIEFVIPKIELLQPASRLRSRMVIIRGYEEPEAFLQAAKRQLNQLQIEGELRILQRSDGKLNRKTIKVRQQTLIGFGVEINGLSPEDSLILQQKGIGGKPKMGCGIFLPLRSKSRRSS